MYVFVFFASGQSSWPLGSSDPVNHESRWGRRVPGFSRPTMNFRTFLLLIVFSHFRCRNWYILEKYLGKRTRYRSLFCYWSLGWVLPTSLIHQLCSCLILCSVNTFYYLLSILIPFYSKVGGILLSGQAAHCAPLTGWLRISAYWRGVGSPDCRKILVSDFFQKRGWKSWNKAVHTFSDWAKSIEALVQSPINCPAASHRFLIPSSDASECLCWNRVNPSRTTQIEEHKKSPAR